jgi:hypothetical protein
MHDIESMRSAAGLPSSLVTYFTNVGLNAHAGLSACMESIAEKVTSFFLFCDCLACFTTSPGYSWMC